MKYKFLFDNNNGLPNITRGWIFKNEFIEKGRRESHMVELDITKLQKELGIDKDESVKVAEAVVKSIWRMKSIKE